MGQYIDRCIKTVSCRLRCCPSELFTIEVINNVYSWLLLLLSIYHKGRNSTKGEPVQGTVQNTKTTTQTQRYTKTIQYKKLHLESTTEAISSMVK